MTQQSHALSLYWFQQAANQGGADAQFNLGRIYGKAIGWFHIRGRPGLVVLARGQNLSLKAEFIVSVRMTADKTQEQSAANSIARSHTDRDA